MGENTRLHDGIVGSLLLIGSLLAYFVHIAWLVLPAAVAVLMIQSAFTGMCPVYYTLAKLRHSDDQKHHGMGTPLHH